MNKKIVISNFKMNKGNGEVAAYFDELLPTLNPTSSVKVMVCVPFTALELANQKCNGSKVLVGAQNINENEKGAFTGEISANMVISTGAKLTLVGHSERRSIFSETNEQINKKILRALNSNLVCVLCIGESMFERKNDKTTDVLTKQLVECLSGVYSNELKNIIIAYEPIWAIGTGKVPTEQEIKDAMALITKVLSSIYDEKTAQSISILYGGSVDDVTIKSISKIKGVGGVLVGGASLDPAKFLRIISTYEKK